MPTITSTATGGPWSAGSTWVGGSAPAVGDTAVVATTGGNAVTVDGATTVAACTVNANALLAVPNNFAVTSTAPNALDLLGTLDHTAGTITIGATPGNTNKLLRIQGGGKYQSKTPTADCVLYIYGNLDSQNYSGYDVDFSAYPQFTHTRKHYNNSSGGANSLNGSLFRQKGYAKTTMVPVALDASVGAGAVTVPTPVNWAANDSLWVSRFSNTASGVDAHTVSSLGAPSGGNTQVNLAGTLAYAVVSAVDHKWGQYVLNRSKNVRVVGEYTKTVNTSFCGSGDSANVLFGSTVDVEHVLYDHYGASYDSLQVNLQNAGGGYTLILKEILFENTKAAGTAFRSTSGLRVGAGAGVNCVLTADSYIGEICFVGITSPINYFQSIHMTNAKVGVLASFYHDAMGPLGMNWLGFSDSSVPNVCFSKILIVGKNSSSPSGLYYGTWGSPPFGNTLSEAFIDELICFAAVQSTNYGSIGMPTSAPNFLYPIADYATPYAVKECYVFFCGMAPHIWRCKSMTVLGCSSPYSGFNVDDLTVGGFSDAGINVNSGAVNYGPSGPGWDVIGKLTTTGTFSGDKVAQASGGEDLLLGEYVYTSTPGFGTPLGPLKASSFLGLGAHREFGGVVKGTYFEKMNGVLARYGVQLGGIITDLVYGAKTPHSSCSAGLVLDPTYKYKFAQGQPPLTLQLAVPCRAGVNAFAFKVAKSTAGYNGKLRFFVGKHLFALSDVAHSVTDLDGGSMATYDGSDAGWSDVVITLTTTKARSIEWITLHCYDGTSSGSVYLCANGLASSGGKVNALIPVEGGGGGTVITGVLADGGMNGGMTG